MTPSQILKVYNGNKAAAARAIGIAPSTFRNRLDAEARIGNSSPSVPKRAGALTFPDLPDRDEPLEQLLARCEDHYMRERAYKDASEWQQIRVDEELPIGVALMGDPHLDDGGCNLPLLRSDMKIVAETEGCYGLNVGDYTNNWVGRLTRLFAEQELSQSSARRLIEWYLLHSGVNWLAVILGNHDEWNEGGEIIRRMCAHRVEIPIHEWQAKLELVFPNGATCRLKAAHDFKGRSQFTPLHGLKKEAIWCQDGTHLAVGGHIHFGGIEQCELPGGHNPWLVRVRGYKEMDSYAEVNGFHEGRRFPSVMAIIDPGASPENRVMVFGSLAQGAAVLTAMRKQRASALPQRQERSTSRQSSKSRSQSGKARTPTKRRRGASPSPERSTRRASKKDPKAAKSRARA